MGRFCKRPIVEVEANRLPADAFIQRDLDSVRLEDLLNNLALVGMQMKAARAARRHEAFHLAQAAGRTLPLRAHFFRRRIASQLAYVLRKLWVVRIQLEGMLERGA